MLEREIEYRSDEARLLLLYFRETLRRRVRGWRGREQRRGSKKRWRRKQRKEEIRG